ncbi:hypothetical protein PG988_001786 [Apiospora saccharicola]
MPDFFQRQFWVTPPPANRGEVDLSGKTAIVTEADSSLGLECARQLCELGISRLILAVSDKQIPKRSGLEAWELDYPSYESITSFADHARELDRLDIFINNADMFKKGFAINPSTGHEEMVQFNYLSPTLLMLLILPIMQDKNPRGCSRGRLVNVSYEQASCTRLKRLFGRRSSPLLAELDDEVEFNQQSHYRTTKLLGKLFLAELVRHVPPSVAILNTAGPGLPRGSDGSLAGFFRGMVDRLFARTADVGARVVTDAAVKHGVESHGRYLADGEIQE